MNEAEPINAPEKLEVRDVKKSFLNGDVRAEILTGVSFSLDSGQSMAIVGPSGSGKSTLMQIVGGLDSADDGRVRFGLTEVTELSATALAKFRNENLGFIFQDHHLLPQLTVMDNVLVPTLAFGRSTPQQIQRAGEILDSIGLGDRKMHRPSQLSGGQRERVAIARALIMQPTLILADEPTGNLDQRTAAQVTEILTSLPQEHGAMLIAVTHSSTLADAMQQQFELVDGKLIPLSPIQSDR